MIRTIISLDSDEKHWLDEVAKKKHISMAAVIRNAIKAYRLQNANYVPTNIDVLLSKTKGIWEHHDGLDYQSTIRDEWET